MIQKNNDFIKDIRSNLRGGKGDVELIPILPEEYQNPKCRMFAKITLEKNCEIGFHTHEGEVETYYMLSGCAIATDEDKEVEMKAGDAMYTGFGKGHAIKNVNDEPVVFLALILLD